MWGAVLEALNGTDNEWMVKMIRALNYGHIKEFDALWSSDAAAINAHQIVVNSKQVGPRFPQTDDTACIK